MKRKHFIFITIFFMFVLIPYWLVAQEGGKIPVAISPGSDSQSVIVWQSCPTFSWSSVKQAASYRIAIFELIDAMVTTYENLASTTSPVLIKDIPGPALSWTLSSEESLKPGSFYIWYVQALDEAGNNLGYWSDGKSFKVEQEIQFIGIEEKLTEKLREYGVNEEIITNVLNEVKSEVKEVTVKKTRKTISPDVNIVNGYEGDSNTFYGLQAGYSCTTGSYNTFIGSGAGYFNSSANSNTFLGYYAGYGNTTGNLNTFIGRSAGYQNTTGSNNTFIGHFSGYSNSTGSLNTTLGTYAGNSNTTGYSNTFLGNRTGHSNTTGFNNTFIGQTAGYANNTGYGNIFLGYSAGSDETGSNKLYIANSGTSSPLIYGEFDNTLLKVNGNLKVTGYLSLDNGITQINSSEINLLNGKTTIVTGSTDNDKLVTKGYVDENDDVGGGLTGSDMSDTYICKWDDANTRLVNSLISESNGALNINGKLGIGTSTPAYPVEVDTTGLNSCILVKRTDGAANYINATDAYANFGSTTNHPLRLVVNSSWKMRLNTDGSLDMSNGASCTTGGVWTNASSRSLKENIENLNIGEALDALIKLNPVKYNYKLDSSDKHVGFIAEDVPDLVATSDRKGLSPMDITAVLTKVVQELKKENEEQKLINNEQKKIISDLQERITRLEKN